ncbi:MAG: L,D-transpeptidase family protein [Gammaproteobacteria bacterium]|nr:L,D-transpeptidase family protein [Gammaproteobacteria bacterium]
MMQKMLAYLLAAVGLSSMLTAEAATYKMPLPGDTVIGHVQIAYAQPGQTIDDVARQYDIGYYEILAANPHVNPQNLLPYQKLVIPTQFILPNADYAGIVVNIAELRLYYFEPGSNLVQTYPVAIGMEGSGTPVGEYTIIEKITHPDWHVPAQVQAEMIKQGMLLPKVMPAGPDNPLGDYALRLNNYSYLIHGTNVPATIGRRASAGCMHMFPEDISYLFPQVPNHTQVTIVDQPFSAGWSGNQLYFKALQPLHEERTNMAFSYSRHWNDAIQLAIAGMSPKPPIQWSVVKRVGGEQTGIPEVISATS